MALFGGNCGNNDWWIWVLIIILIFACTDNCSGLLGNNNNCDCGCGC